jgi:hypothetical protein
MGGRRVTAEEIAQALERSKKIGRKAAAKEAGIARSTLYLRKDGPPEAKAPRCEVCRAGFTPGQLLAPRLAGYAELTAAKWCLDCQRAFMEDEIAKLYDESEESPEVKVAALEELARAWGVEGGLRPLRRKDRLAERLAATAGVCVGCGGAFDPGDALHVDFGPLGDLGPIVQVACVFCQQQVVKDILLEADRKGTLPLARILEIARDADIEVRVRACLRCDRDFVTPTDTDYRTCPRCRRKHGGHTVTGGVAPR